MQRSMIFQRVQLDEVNRATEVSDYASGKSVNVARVSQTLGEEATVTGFVGGDSGRFIREQLNEAGIGHDFVTVGPKTRMCVTVIDKSAGTATELVEESHAVEPAAWEALRERVTEMLEGVKVLVLSGSLPPGGPQDFYGFCVDRANQRGVKSIVDATGEPLRQALSHRPMVVKPNRAELAKALDTSIESDEQLRGAIKQLLSRGPAWAVVTEGKAGATVSDGQRFWRVRPPAVQAISPIGSGDALAAGLACAIARGQSMPEACKLAVACGAANAMTDRAGYLRPQDAASLLPQIELQSW